MRILAMIAMLALPAAPLVAGDDDRERIANDQAQVFDRLSSLKKRMERLAGKLEQEGRAHKAELLRKAITEVDARNLESRRDEILRLVGDSHSLQAHDRQGELLNDLEAVLKLLQDEKELTDLEKQLSELKQTLQDVRQLRDAERTLREKTEQLSQNESRRLAQLAQQIQVLLEKQKSLSNDTRAQATAWPQKDAAERAKAAEKRHELELALSQLADEQRKVVDQLQAEKKSRVGEADAVVEQAAQAAKRGDAEDLKEAARRVGEQRPAVSERSPEAAEALRQLEQELEQAAEKAARGEDATPPEGTQPNEQKPLDAAVQHAKEALAQALKADAPEKTADPNGAQKPSLSELAQKEQALGPQSKQLSDDLKKGDESSARDPKSDAAAAKSLEEAAQKLADAKQGLEKKDLANGLDEAREALEKIEAAQQELARQAAAAEQAQKQLAARQDFLRAQTEESQKDAKSLEPSEKESRWSQVKKSVEDALKQAGEAMKQSTQKLAQGDNSAAQPPQAKSEQALQEALKQAQDAASQAQQEGAKQDPAAAQAQMKKLSDEQKQIEEKLRDLMQRMRDKQQKNGQEQGNSAQRSMNRARQQLDDGESEQAPQSEKEAEKNLEEMEKKLKEEENRYEGLRSEEVLFRMKERLEDLRKRSAALHDGIAQVDVDRAGAERLSRRLRPKVEGLANDAGAIAKDNEEVRAKLAEEQSPTFPWILEKNGADLDHVRELLAARDAETGEFVQVLADDVVTRYERLLQALDDELKRRADAMKKKQDEQQDDQQQDGGAQQRPSLVPPVAELLLLKRLEQDVLEDIRATRVEFREQPDGELLAARQRLLERLGHRHTELTDMFDKLVQQQTEPDQPKEGDGEGEGEQGKDKAKEGEGEGGKR